MFFVSGDIATLQWDVNRYRERIYGRGVLCTFSFFDILLPDTIESEIQWDIRELICHLSKQAALSGEYDSVHMD